MKKFIILSLIGAITALPLAAQDEQGIGDIIKTLVQDNAELYLAPLPTAIGLAMNSGTFQRAAPHKILGFDLTLSVGAILAPTDGNTYDFVIPDLPLTIPANVFGTSYSLTLDSDQLYPGDRTANNIFGTDTETIYAADATYAKSAIISQLSAAGISDAILAAADADITTLANSIIDAESPRGLGFGGFLIAVPQISIGLPFNLEVSFRGGLEIDIPDIGVVTYTGFGGKVGLNGFLPSIPLIFPAISIGYYSTNLSIESPVSSLEATNSIINFQISKSIPLITLYGGFGLEKSSLSASYDLDPGGGLAVIPIAFDLKGENSFRTVVGLRLKLLLLTFHGAYIQAADYTGLYVGMGITFR